MAYKDEHISISNISANANVWAPGEEVTISFNAKNVSGERIDELRLNIGIGDENGTWVWMYSFAVALNIAAGKSKAFSAAFIIDGDSSSVEQYFESNLNVRAKSICIRYHAYLKVSGGVGSDFIIPDLNVINHRFKPSVTAWNMDRAAEKTVDGVKVLVKNDEGEQVLTTLKLSLDGSGYDWANFVTAKLYHSEGGTAVPTETEHIKLTSKINDLLSGVENDPNLIPGTYSKPYDHDFLLVFGDEFETFYGRFNLSMAFANLHLSGVSTGGACFGGFCTSKFEHPKLESYYPIRPYGGIEAVKDGVYVQELDLDSDAPFKVREDNPLQPTVRVFGHVVEIHGELQPTKKITGSDTYYPICTLPAQYAPEHDVVTLQQGSTQAIWMLRIFNRNHPEHPCKVMFSRYRDGANYADATTSSPLTWLPFHAVWCIDGSVTGDSEALAALLMDSQGYSLRDAGGNDIAIMSATDEPYQLPYTGEQLEAKLGLIDTALQKSGGTISGHLTLTETPTEDGHATPKRYVDQQIAGIKLTPGESAYDIAKKNGFVGSEAEWLESLHGEDGDDGYTPVKNKDYFDGTNGKSAYEYAKDAGYTGTEEEFANKLAEENASVEWSDIQNKPFGNSITGSVVIDGDTLRWDGDTTGMVTTKIRYDDVVFVSDNVPSIEKLKIGCDITYHSPIGDRYLTTFTEQYTTYPDVIMLRYTPDGDVYSTWAYVVLKPNASFYGGKIERAGLYFITETDSYIKEFTLLNYPWTETKEVGPIPEKYIPDTIARVEDVNASIKSVKNSLDAVDAEFEATLLEHSNSITELNTTLAAVNSDVKSFAGDIREDMIDYYDEILPEIVWDDDAVYGTVVHDNWLGWDFVRVSEYAPPADMFDAGGYVRSNSGTSFLFSSSDISKKGDSYYIAPYGIVVIAEDNTVLNPGSDKETVYPRKGTYFRPHKDIYGKQGNVGLYSKKMQEQAKKITLKKEHMPELNELIMQSPDGKKFRITIDNNGNLVPTEI